VTVVYLSWCSPGTLTLERHADGEAVDLLVAYPFLREFEKVRGRFNIRSWCLDSGAFTVWQGGGKIELADYMAVARDTDACEVFGLDVVGDPEATRRNLEVMWEAGIKAIPTFHYGSPPEALDWCARHADKIALGGSVDTTDERRVAWAVACLGRVWPKKVHGFSLSSWRALKAGPFHSVDASSWTFAPAQYGAWAGFTGKQMPMRTRGVRDFWIEVQEHQKRARWAEWRWRRELAALDGRTTCTT
jgi:hypothetical protein